MLLRIDDTIINSELITHVTYRRDPIPPDESDDYPAQPQQIVVYFTGGQKQVYTGTIADLLWQRLSDDLEVVASPEKPHQSQ